MAWTFTLAKALGVLLGAVVIGAVLWGVAGRVTAGRPVVVAGDTLEIDGRAVRLWGINSPAIQEQCSTGSKRWACGAYAFAALYNEIQGRSVWCIERAEARDAMVAQCFVGLRDLGKGVVAGGWADADVRVTTKYDGALNAAKESGVGLWATPSTALNDPSS